ncbi:MAG: ATP-binding protein [Proteobacteria bacterium]|nr:MAG: ATP-binding protein [Pseudomonadota bacterium]
MERQKIKEQISELEEQLEILSQVSLSNGAHAVAGEGSYEFSQDLLVQETMRSLVNLKDLVHEQNQLKSLAAEDFLQKISGVLVREARALGYDIALSTFGSGRISMEMAELSMGAVLACVRASLRSFKTMDTSARQKHRLFPTYSFYLEARATDGAVQFRLLDDGQGYDPDFQGEFKADQQFNKIRGYIARHGGWFTRRSLQPVGGAIEFKVPLPLSRFECVVIKQGAFELLLPTACVAQVVELPTLEALDGLFAIPAADAGLQAVSVSAMGQASVAVKVGVADFQFWLLCDSAERRITARRHVAGELVESGCWFGFLGIFHDGKYQQALPLLDGEALMNFFAKAGGRHEGV